MRLIRAVFKGVSVGGASIRSRGYVWCECRNNVIVLGPLDSDATCRELCLYLGKQSAGQKGGSLREIALTDAAGVSSSSLIVGVTTL